MTNARQDSPRPVRLIFDITPSWWSGRIYGDASDITDKLREIAADQNHFIHPFVGTVREIRFDVNRVEIECIDPHRFTSDRAILVHELEKLRPTPGDALHGPTAVHADLLRGTQPLAAVGDALLDLMKTLGSFSRACGGPRSAAEAEFLAAG